jgi:two-component system copper resistance phosphate regulon response regulator CusR
MVRRRSEEVLKTPRDFLQGFFRSPRYHIRETGEETGDDVQRILLIEDEGPLAGIVKRGLERDRYAVDWEEDGAAGFARAVEEEYSLILLDLMLPGMDGWTICRRLRERRDATPILMLTARDDVDDRVRGLEMGADDYLPKPFEFKELRARVQALLRRSALNKGRSIRIGDLEIDTTARKVARAGRDLALTPREYELLEALARREGQVLSREMILGSIWADPDSSSNTVEVHLSALRRKVDAGRTDEERLIHTVHRQGYVLRRPEAGGGEPS